MVLGLLQYNFLVLGISNITSLSSEEQEENNVELDRSQTFNGCAWRNTLPLARTISHNFHTDINVPSTAVTHMVTQWGQFLDHDITATAETSVSGTKNEPNPCCLSNPDDINCFVIPVGVDSFYNSKGVDCLEFHRSCVSCEENGGTREQLNENTHFIDASNVYGHSEKEAEKIRTKNDGLLKTSPNQGRSLLPMLPARRALPNGTIPEVFFAGDFRAGEMPGLLSMHTLFVLEHNRLAGNYFFDLSAKHIFRLRCHSGSSAASQSW